MLSQYFRRGFKVKMTAMFIFVHHPHFLADLRCVCRSLMCKSVSWFIITTSDVVITFEHFAVYKSLCCDVKCWGKMLWGEKGTVGSGSAGKFIIENSVFENIFYVQERTDNLPRFYQTWSNFPCFPVLALDLECKHFPVKFNIAAL